jgi:hypothetical protein
MVALILAVGVATSMNFIVLAVFYDAVVNVGSQLSENATQILTGIFGGLIGLLGSYMGFRAGTAASAQKAEDERSADPPEPS